MLGMSTHATTPPSIDDLATLTLVDGLPARLGDKDIRYRTVRLRETGVADERKAVRLTERVVTVGGVPRLMASEADQKYALTMLHIAEFREGDLVIGAPLIDLELVGKLSSHDWGLIEQRVFLLELAAEVRYGNLSAEEFEEIAGGKRALEGSGAPQPARPAASAGDAAPVPQPGVCVLADHTRLGADGATARLVA